MDPSSPQGDAKEPQQLTPRHYDTVGIGPVFLSAEGTEVRGTIKASPEDFIVREICKHHATGDLLVADLEKAEEIGALLCDNVDPSVDVKPDHKGKKRSLEESEKEDLMKQEIPAPQSTDPLDRLRLALQVVDPDQSFLTSSDGIQASPWELLQQLNRQTCSTIAAIHSKTEETPRSTPEEVAAPVGIFVHESCNTKENRSLVHDAIRTAFPLLMSDTARASQSTNATADTTTLSVTADFRFFPIIPLLQT